MLRVDLPRWDLTPDLLTTLLLETPCRRAHERLWAIEQIAHGACASQLTKPLGRNPGTVLKWVHDFNRGGLPALQYRHSGGRRRQRSALAGLCDEVLGTACTQAAVIKKLRTAAEPAGPSPPLPPPDGELPGTPAPSLRWTLRKLRDLLACVLGGSMGRKLCGELKDLAYNWKKVRK